MAVPRRPRRHRPQPAQRGRDRGLRGGPLGLDAEPPLIRPITAEEVRPLRHAVLRPGQGFEETAYPGDELPDTVHLGAFQVDRLVGVASLYREDRVEGPAGGWRLRGMATDPSVRGAGFGAELLWESIRHVERAGGTELWCNARMGAVGFYRRAGFEVVSDEFDVAGIGAHVVMVRATAPAGPPMRC